MAAQIEFEMWNNSTESVPKVSKKQYKPRNASKADKAIRTTKAMKDSAEKLNPNFKDSTINLIDSFFKTEG
jgi:hypothetical protein